jgi:hypothetical protein
LIDLIDIDVGSGSGLALLAAVTDRHGAQLARAASLPSRLFLLQAPWAPGLRLVGGQADPGRVLSGVEVVSPIDQPIAFDRQQPLVGRQAAPSQRPTGGLVFGLAIDRVLIAHDRMPNRKAPKLNSSGIALCLPHASAGFAM